MTHPTQGTSVPAVFNFQSHEVRTVTHNGEIWFIAADVCKALGIQNASQVINRLDSDERAMLNIGRQGDANIVNESGLYALILRCRDAVTPGTVPHQFRKWVTSEVLPAIRKTGCYETASATLPSELRDLVKAECEKLLSPQAGKPKALTFDAPQVSAPRSIEERMHNRALEIAKGMYLDCLEQMQSERSRRIACGTPIEDWTPLHAHEEVVRQYKFIANWMEQAEKNIRFDIQRLQNIYGKGTA